MIFNFSVVKIENKYGAAVERDYEFVLF